MMELVTIPVKTEHGTMEVEASVIGHLAVHRSIEYPDVWAVSHVETGGLVAQYKWRHVAVNFATWLDGFCNLSEMWFAAEDGDESAKDLWKWIGERRKHECFVPLRGKLIVTPKRSA